jgi:hypothetical protein
VRYKSSTACGVSFLARLWFDLKPALRLRFQQLGFPRVGHTREKMDLEPPSGNHGGFLLMPLADDLEKEV